MPHSQGLSNNPYPEPNQLNPHIEIYIFKIHSNIVPLPRPRLVVRAHPRAYCFNFVTFIILINSYINDSSAAAFVAQWLACLDVNRKVCGSSPPAGVLFSFCNIYHLDKKLH